MMFGYGWSEGGSETQEHIHAVMLANQLLGVVGTLEPNGEWSEQEKTESSAFFVKLSGVYTLRSKEPEAQSIKDRVSALEYSRAENTRSLIVKNLLDVGLAD